MSSRDSVKILIKRMIKTSLENDQPLDANDAYDSTLLDEFEEDCRLHGDPNCKFVRVEAMANYVRDIGSICAELSEERLPQPIKVQLSLLASRAQEASKVIAAVWYIIECADDFFFCDVKHTQYAEDLESIRKFVVKMRKTPQRAT